MHFATNSTAENTISCSYLLADFWLEKISTIPPEFFLPEMSFENIGTRATFNLESGDGSPG
jgi:hypothetical protein